MLTLKDIVSMSIFFDNCLFIFFTYPSETACFDNSPGKINLAAV